MRHCEGVTTDAIHFLFWIASLTLAMTQNTTSAANVLICKTFAARL
ncbi:MAG: hypothetical protein LBR28_07015 [Bacteroidales bacterium]|nr:hypothetical protein [Bacteroidales bacterium]